MFVLKIIIVMCIKYDEKETAIILTQTGDAFIRRCEEGISIIDVLILLGFIPMVIGAGIIRITIFLITYKFKD